ncbi:MAG: glycosyltransferase family 4 protein [Cuniculiplasma sp.]
MNILQINPDFVPYVRGGGTELFKLLAESWELDGNSVTVISSVPNNVSNKFRNFRNQTDQKFSYKTMFYYLINSPPLLSSVSYYMPLTIRSFLNFNKWIRKNIDKFDLIVIHGILETLPLLALLTIPKRFRNRIILTHHGIPIAQYNFFLGIISKFLYTTVGRIVLTKIDKILVFSNQSLNDISVYCGLVVKKKVQLINIGIDTTGLKENYMNLSNKNELLIYNIKINLKSPFIFSIGRIVENKGFDLLVKAFSDISANYSELRLIIAGDSSPYIFKLKNLISKLNLSEKITLLGRVNEEEKLYLMSNCKVFIIPSRREGFGINAIEAAILGIKTVATNTGAHNEILLELENKILISPNNVSELAESIIKLLVSPKITPKWNGDIAKKYDIKVLADHYTKLNY